MILAAALPVAGEAWGQDLPRPGDVRRVRAYFVDPLVAARAVMSLDVLESEYEKGYIVLRATEEDVVAAQQAGMVIVEDDDLFSVSLPAEAPVEAPRGTIAGFPCYRTVEETYSAAAAIARAHPELAAWISVGKSWSNVQSPDKGYALRVLRLTNSETTGRKPALFINAALHPREYTTAELVLRFAEYLVASYETDADVRWLLDHQEVHMMLQANPDGRRRAEEGLLWRKNHNTNHCPDSWPGVDLNRNFDFKWGQAGSSSHGCSSVFRGASAASEPETQALQTYLANLFPDARGPKDEDAAPSDTSGIVLDIHSHGRLVLWPWSHVDETAPNGNELQTLGRKVAYFNGHMPLQAIGLYPISGATEDYGYGVLGRASLTYELGTKFFEECSNFESSILDDNLESLLYAFKVARTPYQTPAGPDVLYLRLSDGASTAAVAAGSSVSLSAILDDTRYENGNGAEPTQNIAAGEYTIDVPPWDPAARASALHAADSEFDSPTESANARIDTTDLSDGRHTVFVRAKDADGAWGAVSAAFLLVQNDDGDDEDAAGYDEGYSAGYDEGYSEGHDAGYSEGRDAGYSEGRDAGYSQGHDAGYSEGHDAGYSEGHGAGYSEGHGAGYSEGHGAGYSEGHGAGYGKGHGAGYSEGHDAGYSQGYKAGYADGDDGFADGICTMDEGIVCVRDDRYHVQVTWFVGDDLPSAARAAGVATESAALFWFFKPDNWEVLVKVLDGCAVNGHVWVYGASMTDVGYIIRVTDTVTGAEREYRNEPGTPAPAVTDSTAFPDGCQPP